MPAVIDVVMNLVDRMTSPLRNIRAQMNETAQANVKLGAHIKNVGRGFSDVGSAMLPVAAGITALGAAGGQAFLDFDNIITGAAAKAGATAAEMDEMRSKAAQFGADFPISATQAAEGMDRLAAAGFDANQVIGVMPSVITAAVASGEDLATTSDVVSSALSIWNLKQGDIAANASRVADVIQMAANKSSLGMQDFGVAMQYAGAPAATLGVNIESLSTAMAIMKNNGIEASTIGTSLRSMFTNLASPSKEAATALQTLGVQTKDAQGNFIGLQPVIEQMRRGMQGLSNTQQVALAKAIAGQDAFSGLLALVKTSPDDYQEMADAINNSAGSSAAAFDIMKDTAKNAIDGMLGSFESLAINFGTALRPQIVATANAIGAFADILNGLSPETKVMIADIALGVIGFTGLMFTIAKLANAYGSLIQTYGLVGKILNGEKVYRQHALLEVSVKALATSFNFLKSVIGTIGGGVLNYLPTVLSAIGNGAVFAARGMLTFASRLTIANIISAVTTALRGLAAGLRLVLAVMRGGLIFAISPIGIALIALAAAAYLVYTNWSTFKYLFVGVWTSISNAASSAMGRIRPALAQLSATLRTTGTIIRSALSTAFNAIYPSIVRLMNSLNSLRNMVGGALSSAFRQIQAVINNNSALFRALGSILMFVAGIMGGVVLGAIILLANIFSGVLVFAIEAAGAILSGFIGILNGVIQFVVGVFTGNWSMAWEGVKNIFSGIWDAITGIAKAALDGIMSMVNGIIDAINSIHVPEGVPGIGGMSLNLPHFPGNAVGNNNFAGGITHINEKGGEIVDLPSGSRIYPHDRSLQMAYDQGARGSSAGDTNISINIYGANMNTNSDIKELARLVTQEIVDQMSKRGINMNKGAI